MRKKKLILNTITSLGYQIITIIYGLVLPQLLLNYFGSEVNGLVNSITHFLGFITFLNFGIGAVVQSALYKPLAEKNQKSIDEIVTSADKFYRKIGFILLVYVIFLVIIFPMISHSDFGWVYTGLLIVAISISSFAQYFFGNVDGIILAADQNGYIQYLASSIAQIINAVLCIVMIRLGAGIHIVKLVTSLVFLIRPIMQRAYILRNYSINRKAKYNTEPIKQKWNGVAQHIASVILTSTDTTVLTIFSSLSDVSIYSIYYLVVGSLKQLFYSLTAGIQSLLGELWAKKEYKELNNTFSWVEWSIHSIIILIFGCTANLILPFVMVYTKNVHDAEYNVPMFAFLITLAYALYCISEPYSIMIRAGNHYYQTQKQYIITAMINLMVSVAMVRKYGLVGVAIGTAVAMIFQVIWMVLYLTRHLIQRPLSYFIKQISTDIGIFFIAYFISSFIKMPHISYFSWMLTAIKVFFIWMSTAIIINGFVYRKNLITLFDKMNMKLKKAS